MKVSRRQLLQGTSLAGLTLAAGCGQLPFPGQRPPRVPRIGFLEPNSNSVAASLNEAFRQGLREHGYAEGENIVIEWRAAGSTELLPESAAELVRLPVDLIVVRGNESARAAREASPTIPVVMALGADPVATGLIASLAHPGGQVTGLTAMVPQLTGKRLELLKEVEPKLSRVAVFWNPDDASRTAEFREAEAGARTLGLQLLSLVVRRPADFDMAFDLARAERAEGLLVFAGGLNSSQAARIVEFAQRQRLPAMYALREHVDAGGLMAYGPNYFAMHRRAAYYVDRILKGTKPADLPVEQPTTFEFPVNMKTALELGITFPQEILLQITEVIDG
jgi:putative ABC transport system substrate-binding protein